MYRESWICPSNWIWSTDCIDDIDDFVNEVSYNLAFGGNDRVWDMANLYVVGQHVVGEELQTTQAFEC